jgi:ADP-heptose:LPS heptosyltransferase
MPPFQMSLSSKLSKTLAKQKILIVQVGRIGDLILMTAMFKALKEKNPNYEIHLLAGRHNYHFATEHPLIDKVYVYSKNFLPTLKLLYRLRKEQYDFWIDPKDHPSRESYFLAGFAKAKFKIGYNPPYRRPVFDLTVKSQAENYHVHVAERNLRALSFFSLENTNPRPVLFLNQKADADLKNFLLKHNVTNYHCVHISASRDIRYWPQKNWVDFLTEIVGDGQQLVIICGPRDAGLAEEIVKKTPRAKYYTTKSIVDAFSVVKHSNLVISPDTSIVHIAAAFDRPLLGLYSNHEWNYKKFHPLSTHYRMVIPPVPQALVKDIPLDLVLKNYNELLSEFTQKRYESATSERA